MKLGSEWKPGTSWLQKPKPERPKCRPPFTEPAMPSQVEAESPPQCSG